MSRHVGDALTETRAETLFFSLYNGFAVAT
jgi:hypothetical protein